MTVKMTRSDLINILIACDAVMGAGAGSKYRVLHDMLEGQLKEYDQKVRAAK